MNQMDEGSAEWTLLSSKKRATMTNAVRLQARCCGADAEPGEKGVWRALRSDADADEGAHAVTYF